jgi:ferredoxin
MSFDDHPTVRSLRAERPSNGIASRTSLDVETLRAICLECGADDVGFLSVDDPEIAGQLGDIKRLLPDAQTVISFVCRMNREPVRSSTRSVANLEFHETYDTVNDTARHIVRRLQDDGYRALNAVAAFPMEQDKFPLKTWPLAHKPIAVAAGLGKMGIHRCVIHPKFGNFILLGTILLVDKLEPQKRELSYNPCLECKLCVAACPVGAISPDGSFNFSACYSHNYREFLGGFVDWVETIADSKSADDYRARVDVHETTSMWQSLSFKPSYKAAYCISVCPAGEDVLGPFLEDRVAYRKQVLDPLIEKPETIYVFEGSDAQETVPKRFPKKRTKTISWTLLEPNARNLLFGMQLNFQRGKSRGLKSRYHVTFTGKMAALATVVIAKQQIVVESGHLGDADVKVAMAPNTWVELLGRALSVEEATASGLVTVDGEISLLTQFVYCFPRFGRLQSPSGTA